MAGSRGEQILPRLYTDKQPYNLHSESTPDAQRVATYINLVRKHMQENAGIAGAPISIDTSFALNGSGRFFVHVRQPGNVIIEYHYEVHEVDGKLIVSPVKDGERVDAGSVKPPSNR